MILASGKDAAASGLADWSQINLDLTNFHTQASGTSQPLPQPSPSPHHCRILLHQHVIQTQLTTVALGTMVHVGGHFIAVNLAVCVCVVMVVTLVWQQTPEVSTLKLQIPLPILIVYIQVGSPLLLI